MRALLGRRWNLLRVVAPAHDQLMHHGVAHGVRGLQRRQVAGVLADALRGQALGCGHAARLAVVVAHGAQDEHAAEIDTSGVGQEFERLQGSGVLHGRGCKLTFAAGKVSDCSVPVSSMAVVAKVPSPFVK